MDKDSTLKLFHLWVCFLSPDWHPSSSRPTSISHCCSSQIHKHCCARLKLAIKIQFGLGVHHGTLLPSLHGWYAHSPNSSPTQLCANPIQWWWGVSLMAADLNFSQFLISLSFPAYLSLSSCFGCILGPCNSHRELTNWGCITLQCWGLQSLRISFPAISLCFGRIVALSISLSHSD